jgi:hypothetical protein
MNACGPSPSHLQVVPTDYYTRVGISMETSQYSVAEYSMLLSGKKNASSSSGMGLTGLGQSDSVPHAQYPYVDLYYELSPIIVTVNQSPAGLLHFLVRLCAVVGGAFALTGLMDKVVHASMKTMGKGGPSHGGMPPTSLI